ncbi:acyltransferase [Leifsonia sp. NPDC102414]|uniref:acyltransferase family protein n=1 Tax=Leifsonia sp. NPDC102414 TaxID=3364124 RepID=UPI00382D654A
MSRSMVAEESRALHGGVPDGVHAGVSGGVGVRCEAGIERAASTRDAAVDIARAGCLVVVVLLHALMVGVSVSGGAPVLQNALDGWPGLAPLTWLAQVMPLFFVLGGFSSFLHWSGMRDRGTAPAAYLAGRMRRLLLPAVAAIAASAVALSVLTLCGVPSSMVATAGFRLSQPLWFLGVYLLCTAAVPLMVAAHLRFPIRTVAVLAALAVGVDIVRASTGLTAIGFANLLFVWLLVQQLGFWLADGTVASLSRRTRGAIAVGALGTLVVLAATGVYSFDLLANLNPPTFALVLLGVAQLSVFDLARPALRLLAGTRMLATVVRAINARAMTIYSWHMLVLIALAGVLLLSGMPLPQPRTADWWATRGLWLAVVAVAVTAVVAVAGRLEAGRVQSGQRTARVPSRAVGAALVDDGRWAGAPRVWLSVASGAGGVLVVLLAGSAVAGWVIGCALVACAIVLARSGTPAAATAARILP